MVFTPTNTGWDTSNVTGAIGNDQSLNNDSGFNAFPEGYRYDGEGSFFNEGNYAFFWSSTEISANEVMYRYLFWRTRLLISDYFPKQNGFSVRFVRD